MKVLFVCSGNICRSPMAAACFRRAASRGGLSHLVVESAGTLGIHDAPASVEAVRAMKEVGVDLTAHRSRGIDRATLRSSDVVVVMTRRHLDELEREYPGVGGRRYLLRAFEDGAEPREAAEDLDDPIGKPLAFYREQVPLIERCVENLALHLRYRE